MTDVPQKTDTRLERFNKAFTSISKLPLRGMITFLRLLIAMVGCWLGARVFDFIYMNYLRMPWTH